MQELQLRWQYTKKGVRILQTYSDLTFIHIPETIDGHPVTEIGPYCFSASEPGPSKETFFFCSVKYDASFSSLETHPIDMNTLPASDGRYIEAVWLPPSVCILHNAAFYNCRKLRILGIGPGISAIGSDVFTNCIMLSRLLYRGSDTGASSLSLILERLEMDLEVLFVRLADPSAPSKNPEASKLPGLSGLSVTGALFFPEYYEWLDEVSPAHLFSRSIHGEGFRMRKCFRNGQIDYGKYDICFENAQKTESEKTLCKIALCRLRWPNGLQQIRERIYEDTLTRSFNTACSIALETRDLSLLTFLFTRLSPGRPEHSDILDKCVKADWGEAAAFLIEQSRKQHLHNRMADKNYDFN